MATEPPPFSPTPPPYTPPPPPVSSGGMVDRIKNILLTPSTEWDRIAAEPMTEKGIFMGWVLPLAAIGPVAGLIGGQIFGMGIPGIATYRPGIVMALVTAIIGYAVAVAAVWVMSKIVDALAPSFGGVKNPVAATKVVAFSYTASFLAGIFGIIPALAMLSILGLYSFYLLYVGLPKLMQAPKDKAVGYTVVSIICGVVISFIAAAAIGLVTAPLMMASMAATTTAAGSTISVGGTSVDLGKLEAASKQIESQAKAMEASANAAAAGNAAGANGAVKVADPTALAGLLPTSAAGWGRTSIESSSAGAAGVGGSTAKGDYVAGANSATLSVTDMGAMGAIAALGSAFNVQSDKTTATGYEKAGTVDGRMTSEKWDSSTKHGSYSTIVANRFVVEVDGQADSADALKALAASVDQGALAGLAK